MARHVRFRWNKGQLFRDIRALSQDRLAVAAAFLVRKIKQNISLSTAAYGPSRPGQYPHRDSGVLQENISWEVSGDRAYVTSTAPHAKIMEFKRPHLSRTLHEQIPALRRIMTGRR
jgi:hypothetical protein